MRGRAAEAGLYDAILVNTCAVTAEAVRQARQAIRRARRENPDAKSSSAAAPRRSSRRCLRRCRRSTSSSATRRSSPRRPIAAHRSGARRHRLPQHHVVIAGLDPGIHSVTPKPVTTAPEWIARSSPAHDDVEWGRSFALPDSPSRLRQDPRRRHLRRPRDGGASPRRLRRRRTTAAHDRAPAPSWRCRTAATIAAPSASSPTGAVIRAPCRWARSSTRSAGSSRAASRRSC